jgi:N-acyl-D-amino-acid deacylase
MVDRRLSARGLAWAAVGTRHVAAIGPATADALREHGVRVDAVPNEYRAESLVERLRGLVGPRDRVLLPRAAQTRDVLVTELRRLGVAVTEVAAYATRRAEGGSPRLREALASGAIDAVTFTSSSTARNFAELFTEEERRALLGNVTVASIGPITAATADEIARMTAMVERALADGACGASSGLEYTPGAFASREELVALCRPLAARRLPYATHMRNEDDRLLEAIDEAIAVAEGARCPLQISHLKTEGPRNWGKLDTVFARVAAARKAGLDVAFDRYPYTAYQTGLTNLFPVWSRDGGIDGFLGRLDDSATAGRIRTETLAKIDLLGGWNNVMVTSVRDSADKAVEGQRLGDYSRQVGGDPYELAAALIRRSRGGVGMAGFAMSEKNLDRILAHPLGMVCSDGGAFAVDGPTHRGSPHPRGLGTFPRVLGRYVRERKVLTLARAVHKMSGFPAERVRLPDRGRVAPGLAADIVVFDPATVADRATYEQPFQYPVGITAVMVNGVVALQQGERRGAGHGRALRP